MRCNKCGQKLFPIKPNETWTCLNTKCDWVRLVIDKNNKIVFKEVGNDAKVRNE